MQLLPKWVLTNPLPGVYDTESGTAADMTAKVYGAMNTLIEEYNNFAENSNRIIEEFKNSTEQNAEAFGIALRQEFQDFIDVLEVKIASQDLKISDQDKKLAGDIKQLITEYVQGMKDSGELSETIATTFNNMEERTAALEGKVTPELTTEQNNSMIALVNKYISNKDSFYYENTATRNIYKDNGCYNENGAVAVNCGLICQLIWAGVDPATFAGKKDTFDGTLTKTFDWGYQFTFPNRTAYALTKSDGSYYGFTKPNEDSFEGSYSENSFYSPNAENEWKQQPKAFVYASDMANELYLKGCEVTMREAKAGDLVFFESKRLDDGYHDDSEKSNFRRISHVALITNVDRNAGLIKIVESSDWWSGGQPRTLSMSPGVNSYCTRMADFNNRICMVARHPAAFGISSPVGDKFTIL